MADNNDKAVRAAGSMMIITLVGKVLGLVRDMLLAANYGSGMEANAFLTASRIPRVFFDAIFASAISASFIPIFNECLEKKGKDEAFKFTNKFVSLIFVVRLHLLWQAWLLHHSLSICLRSALMPKRHRFLQSF